VQGFFLGECRGAGFWVRLSHGYVVDFLDFKLPVYGKLVPASGGHWPAFNVADSCICVAAFLLVVASFRDGKERDGKEQDGEEQDGKERDGEESESVEEQA